MGLSRPINKMYDYLPMPCLSSPIFILCNLISLSTIMVVHLDLYIESHTKLVSDVVTADPFQY